MLSGVEHEKSFYNLGAQAYLSKNRINVVMILVNSLQGSGPDTLKSQVHPIRPADIREAMRRYSAFVGPFASEIVSLDSTVMVISFRSKRSGQSV